MTKNQIKDKKKIFALIIPAALPLIACIVMTAVSGKTIFDVWAPYSGWNDELFYFKQAQAVAKYGIPQGIWGYNESHAVYGGFGAWGPLIVYPLALALKLTGGAMWTPIVFNMILLSAALFFVAKSIGADIKKSVLLTAGICFFIPLWRYTLSYMSEAMILSLVLVFIALLFCEINKHSFVHQILMSVVLIYLISLRPYFILFALFQAYVGYRGKKRWVLFSVLTAFCGMGLYLIIGKYFTADYFDGIYVDWLGKSITHGPRLVLEEMWQRFVSTFNRLIFDMRRTILLKEGNAELWIAFFVTCLILLIDFVLTVIETNKEIRDHTEAFLKGILLCSQAAVFIAILTMYNTFDGDRHLIAFIVLDIVLFAAFSKYKIINTGIVAAAFIFLLILVGHNYSVPMCDRAHRAEFAGLKSELKEVILLEKGTGWNNTVLVPDDDIERAPGAGFGGIELLYALPEGISVNYCEEAYVLSNFDNLKAGRIIAFEGSECDLTAKEKGLEKIGSVREYNIYKNK